MVPTPTHAPGAQTSSAQTKLARVMWVIGAIALTLPLLSIWRPDEVPVSFKLLVTALLAVAALRPVAGLMALAVLGPVVLPLIITIGQPPFGANESIEAMVLGVLAGIAWRWVVTGPPAGGRLARPSMLLAAVAAASAVTLLGALQLITEPLPTFLHTLWEHLSRFYFYEAREFPAWHEAAVWIEALLLAVIIERLVHREPRSGQVLAWTAVCGLTLEAWFSLLRLVEIANRNADPVSAFWRHALTTRISPHFPDMNAVGSLFAVGAAAWVVVAIGPKVARSTRAVALFGAVVVGAALWLTGSRAALGATLVTVAVVWLALRRPSWRAVLAALLVTVAAGAMFVATNPSLAPRATAGIAMKVRIGMADIGARMVADHPWFGVGLAEFSRQSTEYADRNLVMLFPPLMFGENAHNQLIQIAGELGGVGLLAFLFYWSRVLFPAFVSLRAGGSSLWLWAFTAGLCAFHLSALMGHPFLTPYVVVMVFVFVGIVSGLTPEPRPSTHWWPRVVVAAACIALAASVPTRIRETAAAQGRLVIGASPLAGEVDGIRYRVASATSTWFVRAPAKLITMPLRASADSRASCTVQIHMDGTPADHVVVDGQAWRQVRFVIEAIREVGSHRLDVIASGDGCVLLVGQILRQ